MCTFETTSCGRENQSEKFDRCCYWNGFPSLLLGSRILGSRHPEPRSNSYQARIQEEEWALSNGPTCMELLMAADSWEMDNEWGVREWMHWDPGEEKTVSSSAGIEIVLFKSMAWNSWYSLLLLPLLPFSSSSFTCYCPCFSVDKLKIKCYVNLVLFRF